MISLFKGLIVMFGATLLLLSVSIFISLSGFAQTEDDKSDMDQRILLNNPQVNMGQISSLFLTSNEENLLIDARKGLVTRPPTVSEFEEEQKESESAVRPSGPREVSLAGILYHSDSDWTIWLNSQKITPKNLPSAILDISVTKDFVKMKWLDVQTNQIFPVKLRPHQRFNFDTRIFLPG